MSTGVNSNMNTDTFPSFVSVRNDLVPDPNRISLHFFDILICFCQIILKIIAKNFDKQNERKVSTIVWQKNHFRTIISSSGINCDLVFFSFVYSVRHTDISNWKMTVYVSYVSSVSLLFDVVFFSRPSNRRPLTRFIDVHCFHIHKQTCHHQHQHHQRWKNQCEN